MFFILFSFRKNRTNIVNKSFILKNFVFQVNEHMFLENEIVRRVPFQLTGGQTDAVRMLASFVSSEDARRAFLLCGYAGTGKTTVISALVRALRAIRRRTVLLAPTGRAAKVFSLYSDTPAYTIHKKIYRQKSALDDTVFSLDNNLYEDTVFIVDESSMISNDGVGAAAFGSGRLLDDLISYVYSGKGCSLLLTGDTAQLPPVGEIISPALDASALQSYGLSVSSYVLTDVVRQNSDSGILYNATLLRKFLVSQPGGKFVFHLDGYSDLYKIRGDELIEHISGCYSRDGVEQTIVLCRSNRRAIVYNNGIRSTILDREERLCRGDLIMVVKNNYFWTERLIADALAAQEPVTGIPTFIANGDMAEVRRIRHEREMYGFSFADVTLTFPDYDDYEMDVTLMLDTLSSEAPALTREQQESFFQKVLEDYSDIPDRRERARLIRQNPYFNAFQVKYAYAVTCHKAQGGQWTNVFIDQGYVPSEESGPDYFRWLYTALTRSTKNVYLVNWPD